MDYMSNDIDSQWVFHTNEESNETNLNSLLMINPINLCLKAFVFRQRNRYSFDAKHRFYAISLQDPYSQMMVSRKINNMKMIYKLSLACNCLLHATL